MTPTDYFMGRDRLFAADLTEEIHANVAILLPRINRLMQMFGQERSVNSGWRPPAVNANTPNAALKSKHMTGQAVDLSDPEGDLDEWCMENQDLLQQEGLWLEHPSATKGWCHLQSVAPKSQKRVFYP
jgi:hypothetical protein